MTTTTTEYLNSTPREDMDRPVEAGDVFICEWGYDQTNVDFYQVVSVTPSGKSVRVRPVAAAEVGSSVGSIRVTPLRDRFIGEQFTRRIHHSDDWHPYFGVASYSTAFRTVWNIAAHATALGYGH